MERFTKKVFCENIDEIESIDFPFDEIVGLKVVENNVKYEFLIKISNTSDKLICFGSSITGNKGFKPPVFMRYSWIKNFEESIILYNDPTYYVNDQIKGGWHIGTKKVWYLEIISKIIVKLMNNNNIAPENTLFYGSSSGGHASVQLATLIKKSTALASNFQSFVIHSRTQLSFEKFKKYCFKDLDEETILNDYAHRFEVLELFKKQNYVPHIIYMCNVLSEVDINEQCLPFIKGLTELCSDNDIELILYWDKRGHTSRVHFNDAYPLIKSILYKHDHNYYLNDVKPFKKFVINKNNEIKKLKRQNEYLKDKNNEIKKLKTENEYLKDIIEKRNRTFSFRTKMFLKNILNSFRKKL